MKKIIKIVSACSLAMSLAACGSSQTEKPTTAKQPEQTTAKQPEKISSAQGSQTVLRIAHQLLPNSPTDKAVQKFKEVAEAKSQGRIKVEIYPAGQLYSEKEIPNQVSKGTLEGGLATASLWAGLAPTAAIFDIPFQFKNIDQLHKAIDGEIGKIVNEELAKVQVKVVSYTDYGFAQMTTNKMPSGDGTMPKDYAGGKFRVLGKMSGAAIQALGASPVFMGANEVYLALEKGTVDGALTGLTSVDERKLNEVQKVLVINNLAPMQTILSLNSKFYASLPADLQKVVDEASAESQKYSRDRYPEDVKKSVELLEKSMKIIKVDNLDAWSKLNDEAKSLFVKQTGDVGQKLLDEAAKISK